MVRLADALRCETSLNALLHSAEQSRAEAWAMNGAPHRTHLCSRALGSRPTGLFDPRATASAVSASAMLSNARSSSVTPERLETAAGLVHRAPSLALGRDIDPRSPRHRGRRPAPRRRSGSPI